MQPDQIHQIRAFNRFYTHRWCWLTPQFLQPTYTLLEVRLLLAIQAGANRTPQLQASLRLERALLWRTIKKLERRALITTVPLATDRRGRVLQLTVAGQTALEMLNHRADEQVIQVAGTLSAAQLTQLLAALDQIQTLLAPVSAGDQSAAPEARSDGDL